MLFALGSPIALAGLLLAYLLGLVLRAVAIRVVQRRQVPAGWGAAPRRGRLVDVRRDFDIFGAVAAAIGGTGWGRKAEDVGVGPPPLRALLAGPVTVLIASQVAFVAYLFVSSTSAPLAFEAASTVLRGGAVGTTAQEFVLSLAIGLLCFGLFALIPLPPLDGWGLLRHAVRRPGTGFQKARYWLEDQNVGIAILLAGMILPLFQGLPLFLFLLDLITLPVLLIWA